VLVLLTTFLFFSIAGAEETPSVETEQGENQQPQQAEEIQGKEPIEKKRHVETDSEEQQQPQENEEADEEEPTEGSPILSRLPVEKVTLGGFIDLDYDYYEAVLI